MTLRETLVHEHEALAEDVEEIRLAARRMRQLTRRERAARRDEIVHFVREMLLPHAIEEERGLYQQVGRVLGHPEATAPMFYDHLAIRERGEDLAAADPGDVGRLEEVLYGLHALVVEHFRKEEELYLPLLERLAPADDGYRVLVHEP